MPKDSKALLQTLELQSIALQASSLLSHDLLETKDKTLRTRQAASIAALVKAFDTLEDRKRILKGKPLPGSLKQLAPVRKPKRQSKLAMEVIETNSSQNNPSKESLSVNQGAEPTPVGGTTTA